MKTTPVTIHLEKELLKEIENTKTELREDGLKGFSRTLLLNIAAKHFISIYKKGGLKALKNIIGEDYQDNYDRRFGR